MEKEEFLTVREARQRKRERIEKVLPKKASAQKEFIRDLLARHQDKFEDVMNIIAECDPVRYAELYVKLSTHLIPKQNQLNVNVGLNQDYQALQALASTRVGADRQLGFERTEEIRDADFEELKDLGGDV